MENQQNQNEAADGRSDSTAVLGGKTTKNKISKQDMQILADELDADVRVLQQELEEKTKELESRKEYAKAARALFLGLEYGGLSDYRPPNAR